MANDSSNDATEKILTAIENLSRKLDKMKPGDVIAAGIAKKGLIKNQPANARNLEEFKKTLLTALSTDPTFKANMQRFLDIDPRA